MTNKIIASLHAIGSSGDKRHEVYEIEMQAGAEAERALFRKVGSSGWAADHYLLEMQTPVGAVSIPLPPDDGFCVLAEEALRCHVPARFRAQAWVDDYAMDVDDGLVEFNAVGALINRDLDTAQSMFAKGNDFDALADGLAARERHSGPFEVDIEEADVLRVVCLLSGMHGALGENDSMRDVKPSMWDDFCINARGILAAKALARETRHEAAVAHLIIHGHKFEFSGVPGQVCAIKCSWSSTAEDDAWRLSYSLMEANLLALYSAGVLYKDGRFDPKVVEAMGTVFDAMEPAIERLDDAPMDLGQSSPAQRGANG